MNKDRMSEQCCFLYNRNKGSILVGCDFRSSVVYKALKLLKARNLFLYWILLNFSLSQALHSMETVPCTKESNYTKMSLSDQHHARLFSQ